MQLSFVYQKKKTSILSSVTLIDFPVSCIQCRFVCSVRYLRISLSQNLWKYWIGVIFSALGGGELNFSPFKRSIKWRGSFFLHLYTRFALFFCLDMLFFWWVTDLVLSFIHIFVCSLVIIFCFIVAVLIFFKFVLLLIIIIFIFCIRHFWVWFRP